MTEHNPAKQPTAEQTTAAPAAAAPAAAAPATDSGARARANKAMAVYGLLRLLLFVVLTAAIQGLAALIGAPVPLVMSALLALIVAFPLSMFVFTKQRLEANAALAQWQQQRKAKKNWIKDELAER